MAHVRRVLQALVAGVCGLAGSTIAQIPSAFPVQIKLHHVPAVISASDGFSYIVYELEITNVDPKSRTLTIQEVVVTDSPPGAWRSVILGAAGFRHLRQSSSPSTTESDPAVIGPASHAVFFMWLRVDHSAPLPKSIEHTFTFKISGVLGRWSIRCCTAELEGSRMAISAPLGDGNWAAFNSPSNDSDHRRSLLPVDANLFLGQRFATDWILLDPSGDAAREDGSQNTHFFGYGKPVLAVADGTVAAAVDGIPENTPGLLPTKIDYGNMVGNFISLDIGGGRFAGYAHLQPGSMRVKAGQFVHRGDVLGLVGNSGNSDIPHLHFQISDGPSLIESEGLPYLIDHFQSVGSVDSDLHFIPSAAVAHLRELPIQNVVVTFR